MAIRNYGATKALEANGGLAVKTRNQQPGFKETDSKYRFAVYRRKASGPSKPSDFFE